MPDTLEDVKDHLRQLYLGKGGIHGLSVSRAEPAIRVYVGEDVVPDENRVLAQLREDAKPFSVIVVREHMPRIF